MSRDIFGGFENFGCRPWPSSSQPLVPLVTMGFDVARHFSLFSQGWFSAGGKSAVTYGLLSPSTRFARDKPRTPKNHEKDKNTQAAKPINQKVHRLRSLHFLPQ